MVNVNDYGLELIEGSFAYCLQRLAQQLDLDATQLLNISSEARYISKKRFPGGSGSEDERRILYSLIRVLRPSVTVECGVSWGGSSTAILGAIDSNKSGRLWSVDFRDTCSNHGHETGNNIPNQYRKHWKLTIGDAVDFLNSFNKPIDFLFEDTYHTYDLTKSIYEAALPNLKPGAVIISHDAVIYGHRILQAFIDVGIQPTIYKTDNSGCGLSVWVNK